MSRIYFDSMLFIYFIEDHPEFKPRVKTILAKMNKRQDTLCTSVFTVGEVLTGPLKTGASDLVHRIKEGLQPPFVELLPFDMETVIRYAEIRAANRVTPADAIHVATAARSGVNLFLTNDDRLSKLVIPGIDFIAGLNVNLF